MSLDAPLDHGDGDGDGGAAGEGAVAPWSRFTAEQMRAAFLVDRPVVSAAAAGSGKTQVMAVRYCACLLRDTQLLPPSAILAITFTREAAANLRSRIATVLRTIIHQAEPSFPDFNRAGGEERPLDPPELEHLRRALAELPAAPVGTVDAFCLDLVGEHADRAGRDPGLCPPGGAATDWDTVLAEAWRRLRAESVAAGGEPLARLVRAYGESTVRKALQLAARRSEAQPEVSISAVLDDAGERLLERRAPQLARIERAVADARSLAGTSNSAAAALLRGLPERLPRDRLGLVAYLSSCSAMALTGISGAFKEAVLEILAACDHPAPAKPGSRAEKPKRTAWPSLTAFAEGAGAEAATQQLLRARTGSVVQAVRRFRELVELASQEAGVASFDATAHAALSLVRSPGTAQSLAGRFRHVLLDEVQDLSRLQGALIEGLAAGTPRPRIFTVGDHRQSIYSFRFAEPAQFARWEDEVERQGGARAPLGANFRSEAALVEAVRTLFAIPQLHGAFRTQDIQPGRPPGAGEETSPLRCWEVECDDGQEAEAEAAQIAHLVQASMRDGRQPHEHAVLMHTRRRMRLYADALERCGIPVDTDFPVGLYHAQEVWDVESVLRLCLCPHDRMALACAVGGPWGVDDPQDRRLLVEALGAEEPGVAAPRILAATALGELVEALAPVLRDEGPAAAVRRLAADPRLCRRYGQLPLVRRRLANLAQLAQEFQAQGLDAQGAIERLAERRRHEIDSAEAGGEGLGAQGVRLMSIHGAKGLEWPVVIVPSLHRMFSQQDLKLPILRVPAAQGIEIACGRSSQETLIALGQLLLKEEIAAAHLDEQARLLYVACTRAVSRLHLLRCGHAGLPGAQARCPADWIDAAGMPWSSVRPLDQALTASVVAPAPRERSPPLQTLHPARSVRIHALTELVQALQGDHATQQEAAQPPGAARCARAGRGGARAALRGGLGWGFRACAAAARTLRGPDRCHRAGAHRRIAGAGFAILDGTGPARDPRTAVPHRAGAR